MSGCKFDYIFQQLSVLNVVGGGELGSGGQNSVGQRAGGCEWLRLAFWRQSRKETTQTVVPKDRTAHRTIVRGSE